MNKLLKKTHQSFIFALSVLSISTGLPLYFVDMKSFIASNWNIVFISLLALNELFVSLCALIMIGFSFTKRWKLAVYSEDDLGHNPAKDLHDFAGLVIIVGVIFFLLEMLFLH